MKTTILPGQGYSRRYGKLVPYVKFLMGAGELEFNSNLKGTAATSPWRRAAALDYQLTPRITLRAIDYEYQFWPSALGGGLPSHGLSPNGFSFGVGYRIF